MPGSHETLQPWTLEIGAWSLDRARGRSLIPGAWTLDSGGRSVEPGARTLEVGAWSLDPGDRSLEPGAWSLEPGACSLEPAAWSPAVVADGGRFIIGGYQLFYGSHLMNLKQQCCSPTRCQPSALMEH